MSIFSQAGETFEKTKQAIVGGEGGETDYACTSCDEPVEKNYEHCPHCGEATVEPVE